MIYTKCVYDTKLSSDGAWVLIARKLPAGIPKRRVDIHCGELALPKRLWQDWKKGKVGWKEYANRCREGLRAALPKIDVVIKQIWHGPITLVCSDSDGGPFHRKLVKRMLLAEAVKRAKRLARECSSSPGSLIVIGAWLRGLGKFRTAISIFKKVIRKAGFPSPGGYVAHFTWGLTLLDLAESKQDEGLFKQAFEKFEMTARFPGTAYASYESWAAGLCKLAMMKRDHDIFKEAFAKYRLALTNHPRPASVYYWWGLGLLDAATLAPARHTYEEACDKFEKAARHEPRFPRAHRFWASALMKLADMDRNDGAYRCVYAKCKRATEIDSTDAQAYMMWGSALAARANLCQRGGSHQEGLYRESFEKFRKAVRYRPRFPNAYYSWGLALRWQAGFNRPDFRLCKRACEKFAKAAEYLPGFTGAYLFWAEALQVFGCSQGGEKSLREAIQKLNKVVRCRPDFGLAYFLWGRSLFCLSLIKKSPRIEKQAEDRFKRAIECPPDAGYVPALIHLAMVYLSHLKYSDALDVIRHAFETATDISEFQLYQLKAFQAWTLGMQKLLAGDLDERPFLQSGLYFEKAGQERFSQDSLIMANIVTADKELEQYSHDDLSVLKTGTKWLLAVLQKLKPKRKPSTADDMVTAKRCYFSALREALEFRNVNRALLKTVHTKLKELQFKGADQLVRQSQEFVKALAAHKKRKIKALSGLPSEEQARLLALIRPGVASLNGLATKYLGEKQTQSAPIQITAQTLVVNTQAIQLTPPSTGGLMRDPGYKVAGRIQDAKTAKEPIGTSMKKATFQEARPGIPPRPRHVELDTHIRFWDAAQQLKGTEFKNADLRFAVYKVYGEKPDPRTVRRWLAAMVKIGVLQSEGVKKARRYWFS